MAANRRSPTPFRRKSSAITWFLLCLSVLLVGVALFYQFVIAYDYEPFTDGETPIEDFIPPDGYEPVEYPPLTSQQQDGQPTPGPGIRPTPVPIDKQAMLNRRLIIPSSYDVVLGDLTECRASAPDDNRMLVTRGFGYLEDQDASGSIVYLVVSSKYGEGNRFYQTTRESGSTGIIHDQRTGKYLDQADFACNIKIEDTYQDGDYRLGLMVIHRDGKTETRGYTRLDPKYNFTVSKGKITAFEGDGGEEALGGAAP